MSDSEQNRSTDPSEPQLPTPYLWEGTDHAPLIHASNAEIMVSFFDFVLRLGGVRRFDGRNWIVREEAQVAMSPQFAKALVGYLNAFIEYYEANFGPIPTTPSPLPTFNRPSVG